MKKVIGTRLIICMLLVVTMCSLTSCYTKYSAPPKKEEVLQEVDLICTNEEYDVIKKEVVSKTPKVVSYTLQTRDRGLEFHAEGGIRYCDYALSYYEPYISVDYVDAVHALYEEEVKDVLEQSPNWNGDGNSLWLEDFVILSYDDIADVAQTAYELNQIYAQELNYNDESFLRENPLLTVCCIWYKDSYYAENQIDVLGVENFFCSVDINGCDSYEEIYDTIANKYAEVYEEGGILDTTIPEDAFDDEHKPNLNQIYINGTPVFTKEDDSTTVNDDFYYCAWYSRNQESYMINLDLNPEGVEAAPEILSTCVQLLGGTYEEMADQTQYNWEIGDQSWTLIATKKENPVSVEFDGFEEKTIYDLEIYKNGLPLEMDYVKAVYYQGDARVGYSEAIGVSLEDFAQLFDLEYTIDEENSAVYFVTKDYEPVEEETSEIE